MSIKQSFPKKYRSQAVRTIFAIIFFIAVYLIILLLSFAVIAILFYSSILVLKFGAGKSSLLIYFWVFIVMDTIAIVLLVFIIMFFFRKHTTDRSGWIEIKAEHQPKLFEIIESISKELGTNFPQKVYLGAGVDAMVFYDANFKNLFYPSKENLMIGLGLVNTMTDCELKAIIAHEFGHFTQRSLNIYSYVYIENQIIYKMLVDEEFYQSLILNFSRIKRFYWIVIYYSRLIRWILRKTYSIVLKSVMALSREMEFHADEVSANIGGSAPAISALLRLSLAGDSFNYIWQFYYNKISENYKTENVYPQHKFIMDTIAKNHSLQFVNGFPQVTKELLSSFNRSKLFFQNQWASHPSIAERVKRLEELNIDSQVSHESAWHFFVNKEGLQIEITEKLFRNWQFSDSPINLSLQEFENMYMAEIQKTTYDERYSYFYEFRTISRFDLKSVIEKAEANLFNNFDEIYTEKNLSLIYEFTGLTTDLQTIDTIAKGQFKIDIFEYDGIKYKSKESKALCDKLIKTHEDMYKKITDLDINIFKFFYSLAKLSGKETDLFKQYEIYFYMIEEDKSNLKIYLDLVDAIQFIYKFQSFKQIEIKMEEMKEKENIFREKIKKLLNDLNYQVLISEAQREKFQKYTDSDQIYFDGQKYDQETLNILQEIIFQFYEVCSKAPYFALKNLLDFQIEILDAKNFNASITR